MKLLLDTHVWLWALLGDRRLGPKTQRIIKTMANELWLSPISLWETALLVERRRLRISDPFESWVRECMAKFPLEEAPVTSSVALASRHIRLEHEDPADRFIAATAHVFELTLVTADKRLLAGKGYKSLACK